MFCPKCNVSYSVTQTVINLQNLPVDEPADVKFCPVCGWSTEPRIEVNEINFYDKCEIYSNCIVEVLENSATGDVSVGWYRTDETEELDELPFDKED